MSAARSLRVGHKGADLIAPGNTAASFEAALACGVDMIEFDVLPMYPDGQGELYLAHDYTDLRSRRDGGTLLTLDEGLDLFASPPFTGVALDVDLKLPGYEDRAVRALHERELLPRTLISTMELSSLALLREPQPGGAPLRLGWSVPKVRRNPMDRPFVKPFAIAVGQAYRRALPRWADAALRAGRCDALMCHHLLVTDRLAAAVAAAGGELFVWTVDDAQEIRRLQEMGVAGVITNDPRLFDADPDVAPLVSP